MNEKLQELKEKIELELNNSTAKDAIENIKIKYLGKKGEITAILKTLGQMAEEDRKEIGKSINTLRQDVELKIENTLNMLKEKEIENKLKSEKIDISIDKESNEFGKKHPLTIVLDDIKEIFIGMGYSIAEGPEVEFSEINFDKLNTPKDHPSRDLQDTFYITDDIVLRTQTSPVQARTMMKNKPPIKIIAPGRVYRSDSVDATHSPMFHQVEGLVVDKNITMADLKGTLEMFAKTYFGENTKIRLRPHHFPFTEPSAEVDVSCFVCGGCGCKVCKGEGWIEILGAGMVHPNVLEAAGIDSKVYTGFAFGMGLERIAMTKFDINDMRYLYENDIRFLNQF
ncbi:MAG: phenylalanine--tRNA ligase subunit alpha [Clostridia bacterium]